LRLHLRTRFLCAFTPLCIDDFGEAAGETGADGWVCRGVEESFEFAASFADEH
jgi:hypothetical protein